MKHGHEQGPSQRQLRVGEQIRHAVAETLQRGHFHDEILFEMAPDITVSEVRVSPDLKNATAYVIILGGQNMDEVLPALNEAAPYFQRELGKQLELRFTPRLRFVTDSSFDEAEKIERLLKTIPKSEQTEPDQE